MAFEPSDLVGWRMASDWLAGWLADRRAGGRAATAFRRRGTTRVRAGTAAVVMATLCTLHAFRDSDSLTDGRILRRFLRCEVDLRLHATERLAAATAANQSPRHARDMAAGARARLYAPQVPRMRQRGACVRTHHARPLRTPSCVYIYLMQR